MSRLSHVGLSFLLMFLAAGASLADDQLNLIRTAKAATALVVLPGGKGFASSFCIDAAGYFVTNAHVVKDLTAGAKLSLVLNASETDEKVIQASVVRMDKEDDLAVLKAEGFGALTALSLGSSDNLTETQQVTALGYPFGKLLAMEKAAYPSVSVNVARVSSLRKSKGTLEYVQLDSQLNPGNSGGPVINDKGAVIGVVRAGVVAAGINFAVPVNKLAALLDKPELTCTLPPIKAGKRHDPIDLTIQTAMFGRPAPDMTVDVIVRQADGTETTYAAKASAPGMFAAHVTPLPPRTSAIRYPVEITFADGSIKCTVEEGLVKLDGKSFSLSELSGIELNAGQNKVTRRDGSVATGVDLVLPAIKGSFGKYFLAIDAGKADKIAIHEPAEEGTGVTYRVVAKSKGAVLAESKGALFGGSEGAGEWVDLLPKIDLERDTDSAVWNMANGVLGNTQMQGQQTARITVPVMPTGNYELEFTFVRVKGNQDLCVLFPAGGHGAMLWLGSFTGQLSQLEGPGAKARDDLIRIINEKPQKIYMSVNGNDKEVAIIVKLNGVEYISWKGKPTDLRVNEARATRDGRTLGLAVYQSTNVTFSDLRVRALSGTIAPYVAGK